jgi:hypothetical protein
VGQAGEVVDVLAVTSPTIRPNSSDDADAWYIHSSTANDDDGPDSNGPNGTGRSSCPERVTSAKSIMAIRDEIKSTAENTAATPSATSTDVSRPDKSDQSAESEPHTSW